MKNIMVTFAILAASLNVLASEQLADQQIANQVECTAKINSKSQKLVLNPQTQTLEASAHKLNVSVTLAEIKGVLSASTTVDISDKPTIITTGYSRVPSQIESEEEDGQPSMLAVADFGQDGKVSVFCTLK